MGQTVARQFLHRLDFVFRKVAKTVGHWPKTLVGCSGMGISGWITTLVISLIIIGKYIDYRVP